MLQTWTRDLRYHPHVHLLVPGGGLTPNRLRWVRAKDAEFTGRFALMLFCILSDHFVCHHRPRKRC